MHSLPIFVRLNGRWVILLGEGEAADAKRRLLERAGAILCDEDSDAVLAIVAIAEDEPALAAVARLKARGVLVNAVDRPELCDFTLPAIVDRDPVILAIGTGGASAGLAKMVRQRIETLLPQGVGALAQALADARNAMRARWPTPAERRRALDAALAQGGPLDPFRDHATNAVADWIAGAGDAPANRFVTIMLTSPDPDDLTLRTARLLGEADTVYHHPDVPPSILTRARADADRIAVTQIPAQPANGLSLYLAFDA